jgi:hypothetical protein
MGRIFSGLRSKEAIFQRVSIIAIAAFPVRLSGSNRGISMIVRSRHGRCAGAGAFSLGSASFCQLLRSIHGAYGVRIELNS